MNGKQGLPLKTMGCNYQVGKNRSPKEYFGNLWIDLWHFLRPLLSFPPDTDVNMLFSSFLLFYLFQAQNIRIFPEKTLAWLLSAVLRHILTLVNQYQKGVWVNWEGAVFYSLLLQIRAMRCMIQLSSDYMIKWLMLLMQEANSQPCSKEQKLPFSAKTLFLQQQVITLKDISPN